MSINLLIAVLVSIVVGLLVWAITSSYLGKKIDELKSENIYLKSQNSLNQNLMNELKLDFSKIAKEAILSEQESLISQHSNDLKTKIDLFKAQEITPINAILKDFKSALENYQKSHNADTQEVKQAIATAERYAKALTTDQNSRGEFGEDMLEQILQFANLQENVHYTKQMSIEGGKPDFVVHLPNDRHVVIDSKAILKNYLNYRQTENESDKKNFINDVLVCVNDLAKRHYDTCETLNQIGFILMFIPIEACVNMIYTDCDCRKIIELANAKNIIIVGKSSLLVALRLVTQLWAADVQNRNVKNIIATGERLYNNISTHLQGLMNIQQALNKASESVQKEINRFTANNKGSVIKEVHNLRQYGIKVDKIANMELLNEDEKLNDETLGEKINE